jgi:CBS domain containing-hemolysin-like protein
LNEIPLYWLFIVFIALIMMSAFFSSSETGLMSLNRYRLKHLAGKNHGGAMRALELLKNPDKLITLILLGNNFINVLILQRLRQKRWQHRVLKKLHYPQPMCISPWRRFSRPWS